MYIQWNDANRSQLVSDISVIMKKNYFSPTSEWKVFMVSILNILTVSSEEFKNMKMWIIWTKPWNLLRRRKFGDLKRKHVIVWLLTMYECICTIYHKFKFEIRARQNYYWCLLKYFQLVYSKKRKICMCNANDRDFVLSFRTNILRIYERHQKYNNFS